MNHTFVMHLCRMVLLRCVMVVQLCTAMCATAATHAFTSVTAVTLTAKQKQHAFRPRCPPPRAMVSANSQQAP